MQTSRGLARNAGNLQSLPAGASTGSATSTGRTYDLRRGGNAAGSMTASIRAKESGVTK